MLGIRLPLLPMEARVASELPTGPEWQYEPKWDGFRCLVFRDRAKIVLQSKSGQPLTRYFPELVERFLKLKASRFALDGEILVEEAAFDAPRRTTVPIRTICRTSISRPAAGAAIAGNPANRYGAEVVFPAQHRSGRNRGEAATTSVSKR